MATILLVEDDELLRRTLRKILETFGHAVIEAENGIQGLELSRSEAVHLIVTDYKMPGMDGISMIDSLRRHGVATNAILISAHIADETEDRALKSHFLEVLRKPLDIEQLERAIARVFETVTKNPASLD